MGNHPDKPTTPSEIERLRAALRSIIELDEQTGAGWTDDAAGYSMGLTTCADIAREALK